VSVQGPPLFTLREQVEMMIAAATARLHHAIDVRAGMELARPLKSYPRRLGQLYKKGKQ
jgi:hypothetical protein